MSSAAAGGRVGAGALAATGLVILALAVPLLQGFPAGHDAPAHLTYTFLFHRALEHGQFPVRWVEWVRDGHAQPLFNFYQPGLYYVVELIHLVVPSLRLSLTLAVLFLWWLGSFFVFLLMRRIGVFPAALAALLYAFSPYVILDVFVRSAFPELAALTFATGVLWALDRLLRAPSASHAATLALLAALVVICHPPTALIFSPAFVIYAAYLLLSGQSAPRAAFWLVPAGVLAFGAAAFYVVPAIGELDLINIGALTTGDFDYRNHFVLPAQWLQPGWDYGGSVQGPDDKMSFQIGVVQCAALVLAIGLAAMAIVKRQAIGVAGAIICWVSIAAIALILMTELSEPLWRAVPALAFVQYPWRYLMVTAVAAAIVSALLLSSVRNRRLQAVMLLAVLALQVQLTHGYLKPKRHIPAHELDIDREGWTKANDIDKQAFIELGYSPRSAPRLPEDHVGRWTLPDDAGSVKAETVRNHELILKADVPAATTLVLNSPAFPGWRAWIDGREVSLSREPEFGYLTIQVPAGVHRVHAIFADTPIRRMANIATLASLGACAVLLTGGPAARRWRGHTRRDAPSLELT